MRLLQLFKVLAASLHQGWGEASFALKALAAFVDQGSLVGKGLMLGFFTLTLQPVVEFLLAFVLEDWQMILAIFIGQLLDTLLDFMVHRRRRQRWRMGRQLAELAYYLIFWKAIHLVGLVQIKGEYILLLGWLPSTGAAMLLAHLLLSILQHLHRLGFTLSSKQYHKLLAALSASPITDATPTPTDPPAAPDATR